VFDPAVDAGGLEDPDHDREGPLAVDLLQEDDLLLVVLADDDPGEFHLHGHVGRPFRADAGKPAAPVQPILTFDPSIGSPR